MVGNHLFYTLFFLIITDSRILHIIISSMKYETKECRFKIIHEIICVDMICAELSKQRSAEFAGSGGLTEGQSLGTFPRDAQKSLRQLNELRA